MSEGLLSLPVKQALDDDPRSLVQLVQQLLVVGAARLELGLQDSGWSGNTVIRTAEECLHMR